MLSKATVKARPSVLWCYKKELGFSRYVLIWKRNCLHRILYLKNIVCDIPKILSVIGEIFKKIEKYAKNYFILSSFKSERNKLFCISMTMIFDI